MLQSKHLNTLENEVAGEHVSCSALVIGILIKTIGNYLYRPTGFLIHSCQIKNELLRSSAILGVKLMEQVKDSHLLGVAMKIHILGTRGSSGMLQLILRKVHSALKSKGFVHGPVNLNCRVFVSGAKAVPQEIKNSALEGLQGSLQQ